jgi:hypothetical protein
MASELGVVDEPTMASTLSSLISLRALVTALVVSDASSRSIQLIFSPRCLWQQFDGVLLRNAERGRRTRGRQGHADVDVGARGSGKDQRQHRAEHGQDCNAFHGRPPIELLC